MKSPGRWAVLLNFCAVISICGCAAGRTDAIVDDWTNSSALAARHLIEEYGAPNEAQSDRLTWIGNGPWKRTVVWDQALPYVPVPSADIVVMEQTVDYPLTADQAAALKAFSPALTADVRRGELSSRSDREEINRLNLNLADDIVNGRQTVDEAKASYQRTLELEASGKSSPYLKGLPSKFNR